MKSVSEVKGIIFFVIFCLIILSTGILIGIVIERDSYWMEDETGIENVVLPIIFIDDQIIDISSIEHAGPMYYPYEGGVDWTYRIQINGIIHEFEMANEGEALATTEYLKMEYRRRYADGAFGIDR